MATGGVRRSDRLSDTGLQCLRVRCRDNLGGGRGGASTRVGYSLGDVAEWMFAPTGSAFKAEYSTTTSVRQLPASRRRRHISVKISRARPSVPPASVQRPSRPPRPKRPLGLVVACAKAEAQIASPQYAVWNGFLCRRERRLWLEPECGVFDDRRAQTARECIRFPERAERFAAMLATFALPGAGSDELFSGGVQDQRTNRQVRPFVLGWGTDLQGLNRTAPSRA